MGFLRCSLLAAPDEYTVKTPLASDDRKILASSLIQLLRSLEATTTSTLPGLSERDKPISYEERAYNAAKDNGQAALDSIQGALNGCRSYTQNFTKGALSNGWTRKDVKEKGYSHSWDVILGDLVGRNKMPTKQQVSYIGIVQNKSFTNRQGYNVKGSRLRN